MTNAPDIKLETQTDLSPDLGALRSPEDSKGLTTDLSDNTFQTKNIVSRACLLNTAHERPLKVPLANLDLAQTLSHGVTPEISKSILATTFKFNLFKNPRFAYSGNILSKFLSFLGNLIKVIEQFVLALLGLRGGARPAIQTQISAIKREQSLDQKPEMLKKRRQQTESETALRPKVS